MISAYRKHSAYFSTIWHDLAQFSTANNLFKIPNYIFFSDSTRSSMFWDKSACFSTTQHVSAWFKMFQQHSAYFSTIWHDLAQFSIANNLFKIPSHIFFSDSTRSSMFGHVFFQSFSPHFVLNVINLRSLFFSASGAKKLILVHFKVKFLGITL